MSVMSQEGWKKVNSMPNTKKFWCAGEAEIQEGIGPHYNLEFSLWWKPLGLYVGAVIWNLCTSYGWWSNSLGTGSLFFVCLFVFPPRIGLRLSYPVLPQFTLSDPLHIEASSPAIPKFFSAFTTGLSLVFQPFPTGQLSPMHPTVS